MTTDVASSPSGGSKQPEPPQDAFLDSFGSDTSEHPPLKQNVR
jgi:hypothetical protein